jgi:transposase
LRYLPAKPVRELRLLTRRRRELVRDAAQEKNRVQKLLEQSSIKLRSVMTDVFGASGAAMLEALIVKGETDPQEIAQLAQGSLKKKQAAIARALEGFHLPETHRFLIRQTLAHLTAILDQIDELDEQIQKTIRSRPEFAEAAELIKTIPGMERVSAAETIAEVGPDVKAFPSAAHLSSWSGVCPGNHQSAGKSRTGKTSKGNPYFRATLNPSAWASSRQQESSFQARYQRLSDKIGHRGAVVAVAHALVYAIYNVLTYRRPYTDTLDQRPAEFKCKRLLRHHQRRVKYLQRFLKPKSPLDCSLLANRPA